MRFNLTNDGINLSHQDDDQAASNDFRVEISWQWIHRGFMGLLAYFGLTTQPKPVSKQTSSR